MKYIALVLMLFANATYANIPTTTTMDKINWEVNLKFGNIPDNCLIVAKEKQRLILKKYLNPALRTFRQFLVASAESDIWRNQKTPERGSS